MNLGNKIRSVFERVQKQFTSIFRRDVPPPGRRWSIRTDASNARGSVRAVLQIYTDVNITRDIQEEIGRQGVAAVKEALEPIKRTGQTAESFQYRIAGPKIEIYSNAPQAQTLLSGITQTATPGLMEWMKNKPEFANLDDKEQERIAFAIRNHMRLGRGPGQNSTIGKLQPSGTRAYNYNEVAAEQLRIRMEDILNQYTI